MPFPAPNTPWPPTEWQTMHTKFREWSAWWQGDRTILNQTYAHAGHTPAPSNHPAQFRGGVTGALARFWWGKPLNASQSQARLHLPLPADLATTSAEQVYATTPTITSPHASTSEAIDLLLQDGLPAVLTEGAETGTVFGGRFHKIVIDPRINNGRPFLTTVHADHAYPVFHWGQLASVLFAYTVATVGHAIYRHLELHDTDNAGNGTIAHALYEGTDTSLGKPVPLTTRPETAPLADSLTSDGQTVNLPATPGLWATYIPNATPQRTWRTHPIGKNLGRSDYDGLEPWFDQIDHAYSELVDDLDLSRARLIVDEALLNISPTLGGQTSFDLDRRIFTPLNGISGDGLIHQVQFNMRVNELLTIIDHLTQKVVTSAGWSQATFGEHQGDTDITATEIRAREKRTLTKRGKRISEERAGLHQLITKMLSYMNTPTDDLAIEWSATVTPDARELAETAQMLWTARAASTRTLVTIVNPTWTDAQIDEEVERITRAEAIASPTAAWEPISLTAN